MNGAVVTAFTNAGNSFESDAGYGQGNRTPNLEYLSRLTRHMRDMLSSGTATCCDRTVTIDSTIARFFSDFDSLGSTSRSTHTDNLRKVSRRTRYLIKFEDFKIIGRYRT